MGIQGLDLFHKVHDHLKVKSVESSIITLCAVLAIALLTVSEVRWFVTPTMESSVGVATELTRDDIPVLIDLELDALPCDDFGLDIIDVAGDLQLGVQSASLRRQKLGTRGCRLKGNFFLKRVKGEFHIAFGKQSEATDHQHSDAQGTQRAHIHRFTPQELFTFNCSHTIHDLHLGSPKVRRLHPSLVIDPLQGHSETPSFGPGRYLYYLNIVPTTLLTASGNRLDTYQYSVTLQTVVVDISSGRFYQPGIFFRYEISPYTVTYKEELRVLSRMLLRLISMSGGIWVVAGWISTLTHHAVVVPRRASKAHAPRAAARTTTPAAAASVLAPRSVGVVASGASPAPPAGLDS